jgi:hypothetical protein
MGVSYSGGDAGIYAALFLLISLAITWLIIYTAVRAATGHALDRMKPRFVAEATTTEDRVQFVVSNVGSAPALDLVVRWLDRPAAEPLARTPLLGVNARLEWTIASAPMTGETQAIRRLRLDWTRDSDPGRAFILLAVMVPSRLGATE